MHARAHTDGGNREDVAASACVILREDDFVVENTRVFPGAWTNNHVEYHGVILALKTAKKHRITTLELYADSELVCNHLNGVYKVKSDRMLPLYEEAIRLADEFDAVSIEHVPRAQNQYADLLCNRAMDRFLLLPDKRTERKLGIVRLFPPSGVGIVDGVII